MTCLHRDLWLSLLVAGLVLGSACARSGLGLSNDNGGGTTDVGGTTGAGEAGTTGGLGGAVGGQGGSTMISGGGGAGGVARSTTPGAGGAGGLARSSTPVNTAPIGGRGGAGGTSGTGGAGGSICSEAACLQSLFARCQPTGTCTVQEITAAANPDKVTTNYCFSDGSKEQYIEDYTGDNSVLTTTVKRNNAACYSIVKTEPANGGAPSYVFKNAGGNSVATATQDASGVMTATCNGGKATALSAACSSLASSGPDITSCDDGTCTY